MAKITLKISGMHCASCAKLIEMELVDKVKKIKIDEKTGKTEIDFDENKIDESEIKSIIEKAGYGV